MGAEAAALSCAGERRGSPWLPTYWGTGAADVGPASGTVFAGTFVVSELGSPECVRVEPRIAALTADGVPATGPSSTRGPAGRLVVNEMPLRTRSIPSASLAAEGV